MEKLRVPNKSKVSYLEEPQFFIIPYLTYMINKNSIFVLL